MATIQEVYIALFGRPADPVGYDFYVKATNDGANLNAVGALSSSPEYLNRFEGQNDVQTVNQIFLDLFGHDADAAGLLFYVNLLQSGQASIQDIAIRILDGATGTDQDVIDAKVEAAQAFTDSLDTGSEIVAYQGEQGIAFGQAFLAQIQTGDDVLTQAEIDAQINTFVTTGAIPGEDPNAPSNQVNFTNLIGEQLVGTDDNDAFNGVVDGVTPANGTVNVGDTVNGGEGVDTLNLLVAAGGALPAGFSSTGVEIVNITYTDGNDLGALNSNTFGGVQQVWQIDNDPTTVDFQDVTVGNGVTAGFRSTGNAVAAASTVTAAAGVTSVAIALDGLADSTIDLAETTANGVSTVSISGSLAGDAAADLNADGDTLDAGEAATNGLVLTATAGDVDTLNVSLTSNTTVDIAALDDLNTANFSGSTGNITVDLGTPDELTSATFGSGSDIVTLDTSALAAGTLTVDLGNGNDTINLVGDDNVAATATTITLGAGNDTVAIDNLSNITATNAVAADLITIADFAETQDVLDLSALAAARDTIVNTEQAFITAAASLEAAVGVAATYTTIGQYSVFNYGTDAYVYQNNGAQGFDAGDGLVKITGFSVEEINAQNFIA